ncbi:MAG TPA: hypothetical protein VNW97_00245 [Candidatus Saccharimonadales bacterium]|nr:hypothetical protein [Candidatus Saccharimonadales bacterium]
MPSLSIFARALHAPDARERKLPQAVWIAQIISEIGDALRL